jgi:alcohol dehydrogenase class IV
MWYFNSPEIVFGEGSLSHLERLVGQRACIVSDERLVRLGIVRRVIQAMAPAGMQVEVFSAVEPDPSLDTVRRGAQAMLRFQPDWIIAVGGGSVMDAAKAMWVLYERPDLTPEQINPIDTLGLRQKARLVAIPTTSGTGSEATWAVVLTDPQEKRKLGLGNRENLPDLAILDPELVMQLPTRLTADTGLDALVHAVEGYSSAWHNDFTDGLCLQAARLIFDYLPQAYHEGSDMDARIHLQNAAAIAGLGFGNSMAALAHGMGHALGGVFHIPHGRAVALCLPYTIEYCIQEGNTRYTDLARFLGLGDGNHGEVAERDLALALAEAIRELEREVGQPLSLAECGLSREELAEGMELLVANALNDTQTIMSTRVPESEDLRKLFEAVWEGGKVEF